MANLDANFGALTYYEADANTCVCGGADDSTGAAVDVNASAPIEDAELVDLWFDISSANGPDTHVTPAGDYLVVGEEEAYRQSLIRDFISNPDEWPTNPGYGAGGRAYVKSKRTKSNRDAFKSRLRARGLADPRTESVGEIRVEDFADGGVKFVVPLFRKARERRNQPILITFDTRRTGPL